MKNSIYIVWAKQQAAARYNLANSGLLACELRDLPLRLEDIELSGPNHEGYAPLKQAIAKQYGTTADRVVTAQGTSMANFLACATVIDRGDEVLIEQPVYEPLLRVVEYLGAQVKRFTRRFEHGYRIDVDEVRRLISSRTRLIVLTSPHNPSGVVADQNSLARIGELAADVGARVLVDEVYRDILFEDAPPSAVHLGERFIATSSLTKSYGLNGLRCGWVLCDAALAERMRRMNDLLGVVGPMPSDKLALIAFQNLDRLTARARSIMEPNVPLAHEFLRNHVRALECVTPPRSMILFPRLKHHADSEPLHDLLRRLETSIVPGKYFESPRHFRLGFAIKTEDVRIGFDRLSQALQMIHS